MGDAKRAGSRLPAVFVFAAAALLAAKLFYFIYLYAANVFYFDQWDFLTPFFQGRTGFRTLFLWQHGPPRLDLGMIALKFLYPATHWSTRDEGFMIGCFVLIAMALALVAFAIAAATFASFFAGYTFAPAVDCFGAPQPLISYPWFVALMFSAFLSPRRPVPFVTASGAIGLAIALAVLGALTYRLIAGRKEDSDATRRRSLISFVLLGYSLIFGAATAAGRVCLGLPDAAQAPRYSTLMIPAFLAIYFSPLEIPAPAARKIALALFLAVLLPGGVAIPQQSGRRLADGKRAWAACYLRTGDLTGCTQATHFVIYPNPQLNGLQQKLDFLKTHCLSFFFAND